MKKVLIILLLLQAITEIGYAQNIITVGKSGRKNGKYITDYVKETRTSYNNRISDIKKTLVTKLQSSNKDTSNLSSDQKQEKRRIEKVLAEQNDSLRSALADSTERAIDSIISVKCKSLDSISPIKLIANGGISNLEEMKDAIGNVSIGFQFRLSRHTRFGKSKWIDPHYLYVMFNTRTGSSDDTNAIIKSFIFPELNKRDFVLGYYWDLQNENWGVQPTIEFSLNRYTDTAGSKTFRSESLLVGSKFYKVFEIELMNNSIDACLQIFPYYSLISVDPKYFNHYKELLKEDNPPPTFHSLGFQTMVQVDKVVLFCNMKYILNNSEKVKQQDLTRFVYTIGTSISL